MTKKSEKTVMTRLFYGNVWFICS